MAITIPTPEDQGAKSLGGVEGQPANTPYQNLQMPDLSFNSRVLSTLGNVAARLGLDMADMQEKKALLESQRLINDFKNGTLDPNDGIFNRLGANAEGVTNSTAITYDQLTKQIMETYGSKLTASGKTALALKLETEGQAVMERAAIHEATQAREATLAEITSVQNAALADIGARPQDDAVFSSALDSMVTNAEHAARITGTTGSADTQKQRKRDMVTAAVSARVAALAPLNPSRALSFLRQYQSEMNYDSYIALEGPLAQSLNDNAVFDIGIAAAELAKTGILQTHKPNLGYASGATAIEYTTPSGVTVLVRDGNVPLFSSQAGSASRPDPVADAAMEAMLSGPFSALQTKLGRSLVIIDAIAKEGTSRDRGTSNSQHYNGIALDLDVSQLSEYERNLLIKSARELGYNGFGFGRNGTLHIDMRPPNADGSGTVWTYDANGNWVSIDDNKSAEFSEFWGKTYGSLRADVNGTAGGTYTKPQTAEDYLNSIADPRDRARATEVYTAERTRVQSLETAMAADVIDAKVDEWTAVFLETGKLPPMSQAIPLDLARQLGDKSSLLVDAYNKITTGNVLGDTAAQAAAFNTALDQLTNVNMSLEEKRAIASDNTWIYQWQGQVSPEQFMQLRGAVASFRQGVTTETANIAKAEAELRDAQIKNGYAAVEGRTMAMVGDVFDTLSRATSDTLKSQQHINARAEFKDASFQPIKAWITTLSDDQRQLYMGDGGKDALMADLSTFLAPYLEARFAVTPDNETVKFEDATTLYDMLGGEEGIPVDLQSLMSGKNQLSFVYKRGDHELVATADRRWVSDYVEKATRDGFNPSPEDVAQAAAEKLFYELTVGNTLSQRDKTMMAREGTPAPASIWEMQLGVINAAQDVVGAETPDAAAAPDPLVEAVQSGTPTVITGVEGTSVEGSTLPLPEGGQGPRSAWFTPDRLTGLEVRTLAGEVIGEFDDGTRTELTGPREAYNVLLGMNEILNAPFYGTPFPMPITEQMSKAVTAEVHDLQNRGVDVEAIARDLSGADGVTLEQQRAAVAVLLTKMAANRAPR